MVIVAASRGDVDGGGGVDDGRVVVIVDGRGIVRAVNRAVVAVARVIITRAAEQAEGEAERRAATVVTVTGITAAGITVAGVAVISTVTAATAESVGGGGGDGEEG